MDKATEQAFDEIRLALLYADADIKDEIRWKLERMLELAGVEDRG